MAKCSRRSPSSTTRGTRRSSLVSEVCSGRTCTSFMAPYPRCSWLMWRTIFVVEGGCCLDRVHTDCVIVIHSVVSFLANFRCEVHTYNDCCVEDNTWTQNVLIPYCACRCIHFFLQILAFYNSRLCWCSDLHAFTCTGTCTSC